MLKQKILEDKILVIQGLYNKQEFNEALKLSLDLSENYPNNSYAQNLHGIVLIALNNWKNGKNYFLKAIEVNNTFPEAYNNLGLSEMNLGDLEKALENFLIAIKLKPNYDNCHNNILKILTFFRSQKNKDNPYVLANNLISKIKFNYDQNNKINNSEIVNFFFQSFDIVNKNLKKIDTSETQIYRKNSEDLNCSRHFGIFNKFNVIPKFCFGCFKVTVQTETVLDLLKLYFVFDKLYLGLQNTRKLMIEKRENVSGNYKGFIYCSSVEEGENIKNKLKSILIKNLGTDCSISLKRGCSEFALKYPSYKKASVNENEMMPYDETWKSLEEIIDNRIWNIDSKKGINHPSLTGFTLRDILVMRNWLLYANKIGDNSFVEA
jgi:tetratricopeptide (TPR) repeat protein